MKKMICLALLVLAMVCVFTGCSGPAYTDYGYGSGRNASGSGAYNGRGGSGNMSTGRDSGGNVSTSRDGTVNGQNGSNMPNVGMDVEIGPGAR